MGPIRHLNLASIVLVLGCGSEPSDPPAQTNAGAAPPETAVAEATSDALTNAQTLATPANKQLPPGIDRLMEPWTGDLDAMLERGIVRVLTVFNPMLYFLDGPEPRGVVQETCVELERTLSKGYKSRFRRVHVVIIPVHRDQLISALAKGRGDIVMANLTITQDRQQTVDFTLPLMNEVREVVVSGPSSPAMSAIEDLAGQEVHVRASSSYWQSLIALNQRFEAEERSAVRVVASPEHLEDGDLLEMVQAGVFPLSIVDSHKARFWNQFLDGITVHEDLAIRSGGEVAWALRKGSPQLIEALNAFVGKHRKGTLFGNVVLKRYLEETEWVRNPLDGNHGDRFLELAAIFQQYSDDYDLDWILAAAQGYQESELDQSRRSHRGAVGVMQLMPGTAKDMGIEQIDQVEHNIHAGLKYLRFLLDHYFEAEHMDPIEQRLFALAAYNAGPSRIRRIRNDAAEAGYDPDKWFGHVEVLAARKIGKEPVRYVGNIMKYYVAYQLAAQRWQLDGSPRQGR